MQGDLGRRRRQVAQPGGGSADRLRGTPQSSITRRCANRWTRPSSSTSCVRRCAPNSMPCTRRCRNALAGITDRAPGAIKLTPLPAAPEPRTCAGSTGGHDPLGCGAVDRHAQGGGAAHRVPRPGHPTLQANTHGRRQHNCHRPPDAVKHTGQNRDRPGFHADHRSRLADASIDTRCPS